jgi:TPR repeat protein
MDTRFALPENTILDGAYRIRRVVGTGGFGITYEALDIHLAARVALKEYYPLDFGERDGSMSVRPKSQLQKEPFEWGRSSFLKEARTLARFEHPSIVRVSRVFEANSTAYMVMSFEQGESFESWLRGLCRPPSQEELDAIIAPLLDAIALMHGQDILHRDIAPDNILIRSDGSPLLLDFGAARRAVAEMSRTLTGIVKAGYSPHEQYSSNSRLQGPWSDLYALGGTLYRAITGHAPEEATLRVSDDRTPSVAQTARGVYRPEFLAAIDKCLRVVPSERPQSVAELRTMMFAAMPRKAVAIAPKALPLSASRSRRLLSLMARGWVPITAAAVIASGAYGGYQFAHWKVGWRDERVASTATAELPVAASDPAAKRNDVEQRSGEVAKARSSPPRSGEPVETRGELVELTARTATQTKDPRRGRLGINLENMELPLARSLGLASADGALVVGMTTGGPSAQAGILFGDVLVAINGNSVSNVDDARQQIWKSSPGTVMRLKVWRTATSDGDVVGHLQRVADAGNAHLMYVMGRLYASGNGVPRDEERAVSWYRRSADAGDASAMTALAVALLDGRGAPIDNQEGLRKLKIAAANNNIEAMYRLARLLEQGKIVDRDPVEAARLFKQAAEAGHVPSMFEIGRMYYSGIGVPIDLGSAVAWYKKAADRGNAAAMVNLGWLYEHGKGVEPDLSGAIDLYKRAADLGNSIAMVDLAILYAAGRGVAKDEASAIGLYKKAVDLGNARAMNNLAWMLQSGQGVAQKDPEGAADLIMRALDRRYEFSRQRLTQFPGTWSEEFRQALQRRLRDLRFYAGPIDGKFHATTIAALNAYFNRAR